MNDVFSVPALIFVLHDACATPEIFALFLLFSIFLFINISFSLLPLSPLHDTSEVWSGSVHDLATSTSTKVMRLPYIHCISFC